MFQPWDSHKLSTVDLAQATLSSMDIGTEPELDCLQCGVCCRQASDGRILVPAEDIVRWKRLKRDDLVDALVPGHFGEMAFAYTDAGACVHLGTDTSPHACRIYEIRGTTCREFERGSWQCHEFRRDAGLEPARPRPARENRDR